MRQGQEKHWQGQRRSDPETAGHVDQLSIIFSGIRRNRLELQGHSTNRAIPRLIALDLWMHWAGVDRPGVKFLLWGSFVRGDCLVSADVLHFDELCRIGVELC